MSMYWSYLTNTKNDILTFETHKNFEKLVQDYKELVKCDFFSQFEIYDKIFISDKSPSDNPIEHKLFEINFNNNLSSNKPSWFNFVQKIDSTYY